MTLRVGSGNDYTELKVEEKLLRKHSGFFRDKYDSLVNNHTL